MVDDVIIDIAEGMRDGSLERPFISVCHPFCATCGEIVTETVHECMYCDTEPLCLDCWEACCA
jgi:hypothetical protein